MFPRATPRRQRLGFSEASLGNGFERTGLVDINPRVMVYEPERVFANGFPR